MTRFQITGGYGHVNDGKVYDEHPTFGRYVTPSVTYVCLVRGTNQSKYYALSNLREVEPPAIQGCALPPFMTEMLFTCAEPPPMQGCAEPPRERKGTSKPLTDLPLFAAAKTPVLTLIIPASVAKSINRKWSPNMKFPVFDDVSLFHSTMRGAA